MIIGAIFINALVLASNYYTISEQHLNILEGLNLTFKVIFAIEAFIKIVAMKTAYFRDRWNQFDFVIIAIAFLYLIPQSMGTLVEYQGLTSALRVVRIARMLRLFIKTK